MDTTQLSIRGGVALSSYTTFKIGGKAKYFAQIENIEHLKEAVKFARKKQIGIFCLGGGSNILLPDGVLNKLVLKVNIRGREFSENKSYVLFRIGAGRRWDDVVKEAVRRGLWGIENLSLIPGTAGGAVYQNIGAYGVELKDVLTEAEVFNIRTGQAKKLSADKCRFDYRESVFQRCPHFIITALTLKLSKDGRPNLAYPDLARLFGGKNPTISEVRRAVIRIRKSKLPYPPEVANAGSFFKNPVVAFAKAERIRTGHPGLKLFDLGNGFAKLSAAQLIESAGWKGRRLGKVGVSEKHALVLVNHGGGKAKDIINLAEKIQKDISDKFHVRLQPEVTLKF